MEVIVSLKKNKATTRGKGNLSGHPVSLPQCGQISERSG